MNLEVPVSKVFTQIKNAKTRIVVNEGSSRSTKTYSIIQYLIQLALTHSFKITITRAKLTWIKATVLQDFEDILRNQFELWNPENFHKTENTYRLNNSTFQFVGLDEPQKLHGRKQDIVWINEAIEAKKKDFEQLVIRTTTQVLLDYNPSTDTHWIYDSVIPRKDCTFIKSTYKDNPFLTPEVRWEIEKLEPTPENLEQGTADETSWKIYGLGERATQKGLIFGDAKIVDEMPPLDECKKRFYGLDFGYTNDPTALIEIRLWRGELFLREIIYKRGLVNRKNPDKPEQPSIEEEFEKAEIRGGFDIIWADSADPKSIQDLQNCRFNINPAKKGPDSVKAGIDVLKRYKINITKDSVNLIKERNNYKWKTDASGKSTNVPVDSFNHGWDGARYGVFMELGIEEAEPDIR